MVNNMKRRIKKYAFSSLLLTSIMLGGCEGAGMRQTIETVTVDFATKEGMSIQNIKKFDNFTSTWAWVGQQPGSIDNVSLNCVPALEEIRAESLRFDLFMGYTGIGYNIGRGEKNGSTDAEYQQVMQLINKLRDFNVLPTVTYFASPDFVTEGNWRTPPDVAKWETLCYNIAHYFKKNNIRLSTHEIWNEPDFNGAFFSGDWVDYLNTYIAGYKGIRRANPDALMAAMSVAYPFKAFGRKYTLEGEYGTDWKRLIDACYEEYMPDAVSWHYYGREGQMKDRVDETENFAHSLETVRSAIKGFQFGTSDEISGGRKYEKLETLQMHVNEFNIYQPSADDIYQTVEIVPGMFSAIKQLLDATDITRVSWAALLGEKSDGLSYDLIDSLSYQRYPAYHTLWMYGRLPVDKVTIDLGNDHLHNFAGVDRGRAGLIVYNTGEKTEKINVKFAGIPFERGSLDVYLVDDEHYSYTTANAPLKVRHRGDIEVNGEIVKMELLPNSCYYIEVNNHDIATDLDNYKTIGDIVKKEYWYPNRANDLPYADIHENSLTAHVGMSNNSKGASAVSLTVDNLIINPNIKLVFETWGELANSSDATLGVRVDYQNEEGNYVKSVLYNAGTLTGNIAIPFGTRVAADKVYNLQYNSGHMDINLMNEAPADWSGRVMITYLVSDAGVGATGKFILQKS